MKNYKDETSKNNASWEFKDGYEKFCIQNILSKVTGMAMLVDPLENDGLETLERCTALAVTLTDQIKYLDSETYIEE